MYRFVLCTCTYYRVHCSYTCIALYSQLSRVIHIVLLVVLCLKEVEFLLYAVTWFAHCELKGLPRLRWTLQQTNRTSDGESTINTCSSSAMPKSLVKEEVKYFFYLMLPDFGNGVALSEGFQTSPFVLPVRATRRWRLLCSTTGMILKGENPKYSAKNLSQCHFVHITDLGPNQGLLGVRPPTTSLGHGKDKSSVPDLRPVSAFHSHRTH